MWEDPIVSEVRRARENLAAKFDFDIAAIFADIRARQGDLGPRLVRPGQPNPALPQSDNAALREVQNPPSQSVG